MKRNTKSIIALLLSFILIISSCLPIFAVSKDSSGQPITYSQTYNSGERDVVCTTLNGTSAASYYTGSYTYENLMSLSSSSLKTTLRTLMSSTHSKETSYADCKNYSDNTDCENEDGRVSLLYTAYSATMNDWISGSTGWNREHVWPQSLGGFGTSRAGSDLHHIRPDDNKTNGTRGNNKFGEVSNGSVVTGSSTVGSLTGGYVGGGYMEPHDNVKGDVARICLYVMVRWGGEYTQCSSITTVFQSVDVLLSWCALDPVDTWEMGRNEVVQKIQGNRNVFIDYPELAWKLYDRQVPANMTTPSQGGSSSGGNSGTTSCAHSSTSLKNVVAATCGTAGYTGDTVCNSCGATTKTGSTISATGNHSFGAWIENGSTQTRTCQTCGKTESQAAACKHPVTYISGKVNETCGKEGYTGDKVCASCSVVIEYGAKVDATGKHSYNSWQINVETNTKTRSCYICGTTETVSAELENCAHSFTMVQNKLAATCGDDGYTGDTVCAVCYQVITKGEVIDATGEHTFGEQIIVIAPTYIESGSGKHVCEGCGMTKTGKIPPLATEDTITVEQMISCLDSDAEKVLLLLTLGMTDRLFVEELAE